MTGKAPWSQVKDIVADALGRPAPERAAFVALRCAGSTDLRREVESLLAAHDAAPGFIDLPAAVPAGVLADLDFDQVDAGAIRAGATVGPYRILGMLGTGGMGTVYLAERADEAFQRQVAIKVVAGALARPDLVPRFLIERRILAGLDHENIARLLDAGTTDDGLPYVVMELVEGEPIDRYCRGRSIEARLGLLRQVCAAVHYAHQRLVIHRDIKASNILVTAEGQPKLLDFGIAKLVEPDPTDAERTETQSRALTPESASPEQLTGHPVTVASDVYSLGVLMYRLLAERKPFDQETSSYVELVRSICEVDPPPPSRAGTPGAPRVAVELDWITLMAMRKEPARRYGSAQQLAEDIGRYLEGRPVIAAPDSRTYRIRKFVRRRWGTVATVAAVMLALAIGAATTYYQARRAERRFNDVRKLAGSVVGEIYDAIADLPGSTKPRQVLVARALEYLDSLAAEAGSDLAVQRELADAYEKIGDVQGNPYGANLGDIAGAAATAQKLVQIRRSIYDRERGNWENADALATANAKVADMAFGEGKYGEAVDAYRRGIAVLDAHAPPPTMAARAATHRGRWYGRMGVTFTTWGKHAEAATALQKALELTRPLAEAPDADDRARMEAALHAVNLGDVYHYQRDFQQALEHHQSGADIFRRLAAADVQATTPRRRLALVLARVGADLTDLGRHEESVAVTRETVGLYESLVNADANNVQFRFDLAAILSNLATAEQQAGRPDDALATIERSLSVSDAAYVQNPKFDMHRLDYGGAIVIRGEIQYQRGQLLDSMGNYQRGLKVFAEPGVADRNPAVVPMAREGLGDVYMALAKREQSADRWREARAAFERALEEWNAIRAKGALAAGDADKPPALEKKIAACDAALSAR